jgi:uncharacterized protein
MRKFLEKFAEKVLRAAGPWERVKDWVTRFGRQVKPDVSINMATGEISLSLGKGVGFDPAPIAPDVFALPGELTKNAGFRMAICLDEFQQISQFNGGSVENAIRNQVQEQREVGYVFAGSQPSLMGEMLSAKRPFHKAGPQMFLDKIAAKDWKESIIRHFRKRGRTLDDPGLETLLASADLIPYDVQRIAHELWDYAELKDKRQLDVSDVKSVIESLVTSQSTYYELLWEQLSARQRAALQQSHTAELLKSIPRPSERNFVSGQRLPSRRPFSRLIQEISWIVIKAVISSWIRYFLAGSERRVHRGSCAI